MNENKILLIYNRLKDMLQRILNADDTVDLSIYALLATKDLQSLYNLKHEEIERVCEK